MKSLSLFLKYYLSYFILYHTIYNILFIFIVKPYILREIAELLVVYTAVSLNIIGLNQAKCEYQHCHLIWSLLCFLNKVAVLRPARWCRVACSVKPILMVIKVFRRFGMDWIKDTILEDKARETWVSLKTWIGQTGVTLARSMTTFEIVTTSTSGPVLHVPPFFRTLSSFSLSNEHVLRAFRYLSRRRQPASVSESDGYGFVVDEDTLDTIYVLAYCLLNQKKIKTNFGIVLLKVMVPMLQWDQSWQTRIWDGSNRLWGLGVGEAWSFVVGVQAMKCRHRAPPWLQAVPFSSPRY
jgi:hypothetical protein